MTKGLELIIGHNGLKRRINGGFSVLAQHWVLKCLARQIQRKLDEGEGCYGWIEIHPPMPVQADTPPIPWEAAGDEPRVGPVSGVRMAPEPK